MKNRFSLLVIAALLSWTASLQAQPKIAVLNLKTVFDGYWKTKHLDAELKERTQEFNKARQAILDDYQKTNADYQKQADSAQDAALAPAEADRRKKVAEAKLLDVKALEQNFTQFNRQTTDQLSRQQARSRESVLRDICQRVAEVAREQDFNLVFDVDAESVNHTPVVLYQAGNPDLTGSVLARLNQDAPQPEKVGGDKNKTATGAVSPSQAP